MRTEYNHILLEEHSIMIDKLIYTHTVKFTSNNIKHATKKCTVKNAAKSVFILVSKFNYLHCSSLLGFVVLEHEQSTLNTASKQSSF